MYKMTHISYIMYNMIYMMSSFIKKIYFKHYEALKYA